MSGRLPVSGIPAVTSRVPLSLQAANAARSVPRVAGSAGTGLTGNQLNRKGQ